MTSSTPLHSSKWCFSALPPIPAKHRTWNSYRCKQLSAKVMGMVGVACMGLTKSCDQSDLGPGASRGLADEDCELNTDHQSDLSESGRSGSQELHFLCCKHLQHNDSEVRTSCAWKEWEWLGDVRARWTLPRTLH